MVTTMKNVYFSHKMICPPPLAQFSLRAILIYTEYLQIFLGIVINSTAI